MCVCVCVRVISLNYNVANMNILYNVHVQVLLIHVSGGGVLLITGPGRFVILLLCGEVVCVHTLIVLSSLVLLKRIAW